MQVARVQYTPLVVIVDMDAVMWNYTELVSLIQVSSIEQLPVSKIN